MKSSFSRTFFTATIVLLTALLAIGGSFQVLIQNFFSDQVLTDLKEDSFSVASLASAYYRQGSFMSPDFRINLSVASQVSRSEAVICDVNGVLVTCSDSPFHCEHQGLIIAPNFLNQVLTAQDGITTTGIIGGLYEDNRYIAAVPIMAKGIPVGIVILSTPTEPVEIVLKKISNIYLFVSLLAVVISAIAILIITRRQVKPLRNMAAAAVDFGHGDLQARVPVDSSSTEEMQELALAFNNMASSLQKSEYQRQEFVANVSHELKTPMTTISGYVDGILDGTIPPERERHYMTLVSDETKRLSRLVRSMLDISRIQAQQGIPEEKKTRFDICECAGRVLITFEQKINAKGLQVDAQIPDLPVYTRADQDAITQVIYNLVDNAVKFCNQGKTLTLGIRQDDKKIYVSVANQGPVIPADELPLVFERFHKLDKSRTENRDGWGLGLYIVKKLVISHGEDISVTSQNDQTTFTFTLPLTI